MQESPAARCDPYIFLFLVPEIVACSQNSIHTGAHHLQWWRDFPVSVDFLHNVPHRSTGFCLCLTLDFVRFPMLLHLILLTQCEQEVRQRCRAPDGMEWNLIDVSRLRSGRLSKKKKKTTHSMQHGIVSARGELQSHPLAGQAQACGRSTQVDGPVRPDGTCRGHWLIPLLKKKRLHFSIRACHPCACPCYSSLYHSSEKLLELCSSSLRRGLSLQCSCRRGDLLTQTLSEKE